MSNTNYENIVNKTHYNECNLTPTEYEMFLLLNNNVCYFFNKNCQVGLQPAYTRRYFVLLVDRIENGM